MLLGAQGERVDVDARVRGASVVLVGLDQIEVGALTLREAVLAVKLQLGSNDRVLTPAVEVKSRLGQHERASIRDTGVDNAGETEVNASVSVRGGASVVVWVLGMLVVGVGAVWVAIVAMAGIAAVAGRLSLRHLAASQVMPEEVVADVDRTSIVEETVLINEGSSIITHSGNGLGTTERVDGVRQGIDGVSVVERLSTKSLVELGVALERSAVVYVLVGLDNPDQLLARVVEVELDLVGRRTNRLITSELELLNQILVGVLGHASALVSVKEDVVDVERSGNQRLVVGVSDLNATALGPGVRALAKGAATLRMIHRIVIRAVQVVYGPQALINGAQIKVDLDLVILKSDEGQSQTRVAAIPELERHVKSSLGQGVAGSADLARGIGVTGTVNVVERWVSNVSQLSSVTDHLVVATLLLGSQGKLVPDVHPVTILAIDALATNLNLNLGNHLLTREVKPAGVYSTVNARGITDVSVLDRGVKLLVNLGESNLKVSSVGKITIAGDRASYTATEIGLAIESLFDTLHGEVSMSAVRNLPKGNLRVARKIYILGTISDELHESSSHFIILLKKKKL